MARGDIRVQEGHPSVRVWQTEAAATDILPGEPVKLKSAGSPYVIPFADGDPVIGTTTQMIGIAKSASTHTASADGEISVYMLDEGDILLSAKAKTASTVDTQAELDALVGDRVVLDLTSSTYTVDAAAGDGATKGVQIVGGNPDTAEVYFKVRPATLEGPVA